MIKWKTDSYKLIAEIVNDLNKHNEDYEIPEYCKDLMTGIVTNDMSVYRRVFRNGFPNIGYLPTDRIDTV